MSKIKKPESTGLQSALAGLGNMSDLLKSDAFATPLPSPAPADAPPAKVRVDRIHRDPNQPRKKFDETKLQELADSIRENGIVQPIVLQPHPTIEGDWMVVAGERRWRAAQLAGLTEVPFVITHLSPSQVLVVQLIENIQREDLNPLEVAESLGRLQREFNLTANEVAESVGKKKQTVSDYLGVLGMSDEFKDALANGLIRGVADLNTLWRLHKKHPERVSALLANATPENPVTRVLIRAVSDPAPEGGAAPASSPAGRTTAQGTTPETGSEGDPGGSGGGGDTGGDSTKKPPAAAKPTASPSAELVYTISNAQKNGEWIATVRLGAERLYASEPAATSAAATAQAAGWLRDHSQQPPA